MKYREKAKTGKSRIRTFLVHEIQGRTKNREEPKTGKTRTRPFLVHEIQGKSKNREIQNQNFLSA